MTFEVRAIQRAYPEAVVIDEIGGTVKADGTKITIVQSEVDKARAEIDAEYAALDYARKRAAEYPSVVDQLDLIYHSGIDAWKAKIKETKDKYPKPE